MKKTFLMLLGITLSAALFYATGLLRTGPQQNVWDLLFLIIAIVVLIDFIFGIVDSKILEPRRRKNAKHKE